MDSASHLVVIGNGITGITCAREVRKMSNCRITIISDESDFFFSRPALMYAFMGHLKPAQMQPYETFFWKKNRLELLRKTVTQIDPHCNALTCSDGSQISYDKLILATGSKPNKFGWPGQDLAGAQGFYSLQDLELLEQNSETAKHAVIVGGGLIGVEVAEMLASRGIAVDFVVREAHFWAPVLASEEAQLVARHILAHGIRLHFETEITAINAGANKRVQSVYTNRNETIDCELVALTAGVSPNIDLAKASGIKTQRGILIDRKFATDIPDIFAAGDCAEFNEAIPDRKSIEQVWYTGKAQAETLAQILCGKNTRYTPGVWFNSAKFFDLEYQVYGQVPTVCPESQRTYYWENTAGDKCMRLQSDKATGALVGIQAIGLRLRQQTCTRWIEERATMVKVIAQLHQANFDPEFFKRYEKEIQLNYFAKTITPNDKELNHV